MLFKFFSVVLLVEIANSCVSGVATENIPYPCFNWGTTRFHFIFIFYLSFWEWHHFLGLTGNSFLTVRWKQVCLKNYLLDDTLDNNTQDGDNNIHENDDDNDNHDSDDNNNDK